MPYDNYAINVAKQFGDIPFVDFTRDLINNTFAALLEAHVVQMQEYAKLISSVGSDLSDYINNTVDSVSMAEINDLIGTLPIDEKNRLDMLKVIQSGYVYQQAVLQGREQEHQATLQAGGATAGTPLTGAISDLAETANPATGVLTAITGMLNSSALTDLVNKIGERKKTETANQSELAWLRAQVDLDDARSDLNAEWIRGSLPTLPNYALIYQSMAAVVASNKYALIQNMIRMGLMRLVVTEGEIETRITFESHESHDRGNESTSSDRARQASLGGTLSRPGIIGSLLGGKRNTGSAGLSYGGGLNVTTTKSWQRDSSGSKVEIYGRVLIRFKTDYAPLG